MSNESCLFQNVTQYACAFEEEEEEKGDMCCGEVETVDTSTDQTTDEADTSTDQTTDEADLESLIPENTLPLEEATENLEIPHLEGDTPKNVNNAFYFYQGRLYLKL